MLDDDPNGKKWGGPATLYTLRDVRWGLRDPLWCDRLLAFVVLQNILLSGLFLMLSGLLSTAVLAAVYDRLLLGPLLGGFARSTLPRTVIIL
jgi:hypothetical protein